MQELELYNGYKIPIIGYGTFPQREVLEYNVPVAYNAGYRMIDTSDNYLNEAFVGNGLRKICSSEITVITKFSQPLRSKELEECYVESISALGTKEDKTIYLLHWPFPYLWKKQWKQMEELYMAGKCAAIGVCNFDVGFLKELLNICRVKPMINQFERHPLFQQQELVGLCQKENIRVMSYSPLARMDNELNTNVILERLADKYGKTVNQIILRWNIDSLCIPIPASSSKEHIKENIEVFDFKLQEDEVATINQLDCGKRIRFNPRTRFDKHTKKKFLVERLRTTNPIIKKIINSSINIKKRLS